MKKDWIQKIEVFGKPILIDHGEKEIIFPEDIDEEELNRIACYLHEEGFLQEVMK
tara:strand:+ start:6894 stop:7058 length:165 start_codon:yes stop_codon:yes gene_type:complete